MGKFEIFCKIFAPHDFQIPVEQKRDLKMSTPDFKFPHNNGLKKSQILEQLPISKSVKTATLIFFDINGKMDLEKLMNAANFSPTP